MLGRNRGKPLTYDDANSEDVETGHETSYQQRGLNGKLVDEQDRHRLENTANNLAEGRKAVLVSAYEWKHGNKLQAQICITDKFIWLKLNLNIMRA